MEHAAAAAGANLGSEPARAVAGVADQGCAAISMLCCDQHLQLLQAKC
jgi:hypothetical protein